MDQQNTEQMVDEILGGGEPVGMAVAMADMLPEEIEAKKRAEEEALIARLEAFGESMARKRDEAVVFRSSSGLEQEWMEDEEAYAGIDEVNRGDAVLKPRSSDGSVDTSKRQAAGRSTVFLNITRPYVDAAAARVADMLLPTDDRNWEIKPTPIPELIKQKGDMTPVAGPMGQPMMKSDGQPVTVKDQVAAILDDAKRRAELAQDQIDDWLVQCQWNAEVRKVIETASRLGVGVLKGPFPKRVTKKSFELQGGMAQLTMERRIDPASKNVDPWNFYPMPDCYEDIHSGSGVWEKDDLSGKQLRELKETPGYISSQIDQCLEEGPLKAGEAAPRIRMLNKSTAKDTDLFEVWYYHGTADAEDLRAADLDVKDGTSANVIMTVVNRRVIKVALSPLESGEYPYDVFVWSRRAGSWAGVGVARQIRTPQRMINAATRNMMDNAGLSSGPQIIIDREAVVPANGVFEITPRKLWFANDVNGKGVNSAFLGVNIPTLQQELMAIIQYASKMAEDVTGLPQIMQGQQGSAPETVGGMTLLSNNASTVLRRIARQFDDQITEPHIRRYYEWLLLYGENEEAKGDFKIDARGSTALIERDIQMQSLVQMGQLVQNPAFGINPQKWIVEMLKAWKLDAYKFTYTPEELQKIQEAQAQQQPDPRVQTAQIKAQADTQIAQLKEQTKQVEIKVDMDRDAKYVEAEAQRTQAEYEGRMKELEVKRELAMLEYANKNQISLEQIKAGLASDAMKLRVQKELAAASHAVDLHKHHNPQVAEPAVEPPGRAQNGQAFTQ